MIDSLNALKEYTKEIGEKNPALKNEIVLKSPGINQNSYLIIKNSLPDFPESYLSCIQILDLNRISIGYFRLWPRATKTAGLVESLLQINLSERNPFLSFLREKRLYEVAAWEAEPICVAANTSNYKEGTVLKLSMNQSPPKEAVMAGNFETFLIIAGNLDAIRANQSFGDNGTSARAEFERCLAHFALSDEAITTWRCISEVLLD